MDYAELTIAVAEFVAANAPELVGSFASHEDAWEAAIKLTNAATDAGIGTIDTTYVHITRALVA